jgi:hypothetical protein
LLTVAHIWKFCNRRFNFSPAGAGFFDFKSAGPLDLASLNFFENDLGLASAINGDNWAIW